MTVTAYKAEQYNEAIRYVDNAKWLLRDFAHKSGNDYTDKKYVRMACGTAYNGVLIALDAYFELKGRPIKKKSHQRKSVDDYRAALTVLDKKLLSDYNAAYDTLHIWGYYEGITKYDYIHSGIELALSIINRIKP